MLQTSFLGTTGIPILCGESPLRHSYKSSYKTNHSKKTCEQMLAIVTGCASIPDQERKKVNEYRNKTSLFEGDDDR